MFILIEQFNVWKIIKLQKQCFKCYDSLNETPGHCILGVIFTNVLAKWLWKVFMRDLEDIVIDSKVKNFINTVFFKTNSKMIILMQRKMRNAVSVKIGSWKKNSMCPNRNNHHIVGQKKCQQKKKNTKIVNKSVGVIWCTPILQ